MQTKAPAAVTPVVHVPVAPTSPDATDESQPPPQPPLLFECAWEVCWQLGGIYTVLRTKVVSMQERWGERYVLVGPYNPQTAAWEFEEQPAGGVIRQALDGLRDAGIPAKFGRWLV